MNHEIKLTTIDTYQETELQRLNSRFGTVEFFVVRLRDREILWQTEAEASARKFAARYREEIGIRSTLEEVR